MPVDLTVSLPPVESPAGTARHHRRQRPGEAVGGDGYPGTFELAGPTCGFFRVAKGVARAVWYDRRHRWLLLAHDAVLLTPPSARR